MASRWLSMARPCLPGSSVLYAGESVVVAFDPWSLVIAIVIYVVMSAISCDEEEGKLAMKEGARLCHTVGTYCSSRIRILGKCVSCIDAHHDQVLLQLGPRQDHQ